MANEFIMVEGHVRKEMNSERDNITMCVPKLWSISCVPCIFCQSSPGAMCCGTFNIHASLLLDFVILRIGHLQLGLGQLLCIH